MAFNEDTSFIEYPVDQPTQDFVTNFDTIGGTTDVVLVTVDGDLTDTPESSYTVQQINHTTWRVTPEVQTGSVVRLYRVTNIDEMMHVFTAGAKFIARNMDNNFKQIRHAQQEVRDGFSKLTVDQKQAFEDFKADVGYDVLQDTIEVVQGLQEQTEHYAQVVEDNFAQSQALLTDIETFAADAEVAADLAEGAATNAVAEVNGLKGYVDASLTAIAGGHKAYGTLAAALANTSTFPQDSIIEITNDGANNGTYLWNGVDLTKSAYDPLAQAKAYTDAIKLLLDSDVSKNRDSIARLLVSMQALVLALNTESTDLNSKINAVKGDLNNLLATNLKVDDVLTQHLTAIQVLVKTIEYQSGNINLNTESVKDQLVATHLLVKQLSEVEGGSSPSSLGVHRGKFAYGASYNVGELFDHGSGTYSVLTDVIAANVTPDQDPSYSKISGILSPNNLKTLTVSNATVEAEIERAVIPASISHDGTKLWSHSTNVLRESLDGGLTWNELHSFSDTHFIEWVKELDNGELLLQVILFVYEGSVKVRDRYYIYRTEGKNTSNLTMVECFNIEKEAIWAAHGWSVSTHRNIIVVGEYGAKTPTWGGKPIAEGDNARYVRLSTDYGKTWKIIFDLNDHVVKQECHIHGVCYDQYWNRIWLTYGDGENGTMYSDDLGDTWNFAHHELEFEGEHQNVGIVALPTCILFATDYHPDGIHRIDRAHGRNTADGTYPIDIAYFINVGQTQRNYVGMSICHAKNTEYSPVLFGFVAETANSKSCVIGTYDGWNFFQVWMDTLSQPSGRGLEFVCGVTLRNEIIIRSNDSRTTGTGKRTKITLKV